ncbi:MAG: PAS domain-containing sensor histidine kinase [Stygiobacter sp.]
MDKSYSNVSDLQIKELSFKWLKDQSSFGLLITDDSLIVLFVNEWFTQNFPQKNLIGQHLFDLFPEIRDRGLNNNYFNALSGEPSLLSNKLHKYLIKIPYNDPERRVQYMQQSVEITPLISENNIIGTVTKIEDVTERVIREKELNSLISQLIKTKNQIQESEEKFRTLAENIPDTIIRLDKNFRYTFINKDSIDNWGITKNFILGKTIEELNFFPKNVIDRCNFYVKNAFENGNTNSYQYSLDLGGKERHYEIRFIPEKSTISNTMESVLEINREITDIVEANNKLKEYAEELERLNITKNKFFSILAHDLRSPFFPLINISDFILEDFDTLSKDEIKKDIIDLKTLIHNLYTLIDNLLSWAQFEKGVIKFNPTIINLKNEIELIINLYRKTAEVKKISLINNANEEIIFEGDINLFKALLRNLISNAIKFTYEGKSVYIITKIYNDYFKLIIKDEGMGMDENTINSLFKLSEIKTTKGTAGEKGTGLGLILCKEIISKHKGEIKVESEIGNGTTFICKIPYKSIQS